MYRREMLVKNRRMITNLSAVDMGRGTMNKNDNCLRNGRRQNNYGPINSFRTKLTPIPAKSTRLNDQCFDFGERGSYSTDYAHHQMNGNSKFSQNLRFRSVNRGSTRHTPYYMRPPVQNHGQEREYFPGGTPAYSQQTRVKDEPQLESRRIWKPDNQSNTIPKVAPVKSAADIGVKGISDFLSPSPWFPGAKNLEPSHNESEPGNMFPPKYNTFHKPNNEPDINQNTVVDKWGTSSNIIRKADDEPECLDDLYSNVIEIEKPVNEKWSIPPGLRQSVENGEFYAKVCEAVLEKVLQLLCPNSYKVNAKSGTKSFNNQAQTNRTFNSEKNTASDSYRYLCSDTANFARNKPFHSKTRNKPFHSKTSEQLSYSNFNRDYKNFAPKPLFSQTYRGRGAGRVMKRNILPRNRESLV